MKVKINGKIVTVKTLEEAADIVMKEANGVTFDELLVDVAPPVEKLKKMFLRLRSMDTRKLVGRDIFLKCSYGVGLPNYFMPFRYSVRVFEKPSPEELIRLRSATVLKTSQRVGNIKDREITLAHLIQGARLRQSQLASNFSPAVAKAIYEYYIPKRGAKILDPCAGWGGRLTGCMASKYNYFYTGVDPSTPATEGLKKLVAFLNVASRCKIIHKPFEDTENDLEDGYDFAFTSPPYFKKEIYSNEATQSCFRYPEYEQWREGFLKRLLEIVFKKLSGGCIFALNIDDVKIQGRVYPLVDDAVELGLSVGFKLIERKRVELQSFIGEGHKKRTSFEPLLVFKKE